MMVLVWQFLEYDCKECTEFFLNYVLVGCNSTEFQCTIETQCISSFYRCDGSFECSDNSDEYDCKQMYNFTT